jgi:hypothetical protein
MLHCLHAFNGIPHSLLCLRQNRDYSIAYTRLTAFRNRFFAFGKTAITPLPTRA